MAAVLPVTIRTFKPQDQAACLSLYRIGLIGGQLAANDTGIDMEDISAAYLTKGGSHFWVAADEAATILGMIGVQQHEAGIGEIRRLRVHPEARRRGIGSALLEMAIRFCRERQHLKIKVDTFVDIDAANRLFEKFHFRHSHERTVGDRTLPYYYLDLYTKNDPRRGSTGGS